jgi:hypothetical protein
MVPAMLGVMAAVAVGCGPLRVESRPHIRGTVVAVTNQIVGIRHKTGRTYHIALTRDTRITHQARPGTATLCPGLRATVYLTGPRMLTASDVTVSGDPCR